MGDQLQIIQYGDKYGLFAADGELIEGDFTSREDALAARAKSEEKAETKSGNGRRKKAVEEEPAAEEEVTA